MQEVFRLPDGQLDWVGYQISISESADFFTCKALSSGATAISLDIINRYRDDLDSERVMSEYEERVTQLVDTFVEVFGRPYCTDLLGFDPIKYDEYPEEVQEEIEKGEWMQKCCRCMEFVVRSLFDGQEADLE